MAVVIETTLGDFTVDLFTEDRPQTCKNFLKLCKIKYYNFCLFHSVQANFLAQTGDPSGSGTGGESIFGLVYGEKSRYYEAEKLPKLKHTKPGLLSMVNCGNNMLGSQFFLTLGSELQSLDEHCVFAEITEGLEILLKLNEAICDNQHRPYKDIRITHTVILEDPFEDPSGLVVPSSSPEPSQLTLQNGRIGADEELDETAGMTVTEIEEMKQSREAQARATILEIVGDLPDAEMAPPENVLFVCKLNPVTTDDDLEIIFSRFGKVKSCEVIRDHESGDSLQYAFIEFEEQRACEEAYFKMDNVLIDDRRIHVDFSQSVAKMRWKGKGRGVEYLDKNDKDKNQYFSESRSISRRDHVRESRSENYREARDENQRDTRDWNHRERRRPDEERQRRREINNEHKRTDKRKYEDCRKSDDRRRREGYTSRDSNNLRFENRKNHDRRDYNNTSRRDDSRRKNVDRKEKDFRKNESQPKDSKVKEKFDGSSSSRNRSHSSEINRDRKPGSLFVAESKENGSHEVVKRESTKDTITKSNKDKEGYLNSSFNSTNSDNLESKAPGEDLTSEKIEIDMDKSTPVKNFETESLSNEPAKLRECSISSDKKLKRKQKSESYKPKKKRKSSTSSDSSSAASDSSCSSSSSESTSSDYKRKRKRIKTVAKKYYRRGKLVKVVKKKRDRDSSESESFSDSSSDSDRRRKKRKSRKKHTKKIVKIIEKRRFDSSDDSGSESSSSDDSESERSKKKKRRKLSEKKKKKKKRSSSVKNHKKARDEESSDPELLEKSSNHKIKKNKKENNTKTSD